MNPAQPAGSTGPSPARPAGSATAAVPPDPTLRTTRHGRVRGRDDAAATGTWSWKGIPFAAPPVGPLRWRAPVDPQPWDGERPALDFGPAAIQNGRIYGPGANNRYDATIGTTLNTPVGSEDCLTLNIWRPASGERDLPVIVFVYGGSNISGYTGDPVYDGANLARETNTVVVTVNYRVGVFGFFALPQLRTGDPVEDSGNYALLDLLQALRFVRDDIAGFGGNPDCVTLMGQSAGAVNCWALLASPLAAGLFHRLLPISGGISMAGDLPPGSIPLIQPVAVPLAQAGALLAHLWVADGRAADPAAAAVQIATQPAAEIARFMRAQDAGTILRTVLAKGLTGSMPIPDGHVLPAHPIGALAAGAAPVLPVLAGITADEGKLFGPFLPLVGGKPGMKIGDAERFAMMMDFDPDAPTTLTAADLLDPSYLPVDAPDTGWNARTRKLGDAFFGVNRDNVLNTLAGRQPNVWCWEFQWAQQPAPWNDVYGAAHVFDLPFVFGNFGPSLFGRVIGGRANAAGRLALSAAMMAAIGAFARNGDPNTPALGAHWPTWPQRLLFDATAQATHIRAQARL